MTEQQAYLNRNRLAYENVAEEFQEKRPLRHENSMRAATLFSQAMKETGGQSILELGPGSGDVARVLSEEGFSVTAIEFSPEMAKLAAETAPKVEIIVDEFLRHNFGQRHFYGILAMAFIHLFTPDDALRAIKKTYDLLEAGGVLVVSTTKHDKNWEGYLPKSNFKNSVSRYRVHYTPGTFMQLLTRGGFQTLEYSEIQDHEATRTWMQLICYKN